MKLIADAGSSKTSWAFIPNKNDISYFETSGIDPFNLQKDEIIQLISSALPALMEVKNQITEIRYFGTGANYPSTIQLITESLQALFPQAQIYVEHDLLGTAIALCKDKAGIACILGTGSNSCYFDGKKIVQQVAAPGYILADEGSGAYIGRLLLLDFIREDIPVHLREKFVTQYGITVEQIMHRVYRDKEPNKFLASFVPFLKEHLEDAYCENLMTRVFEDFYHSNLTRYAERENISINFTGGIAYHFATILEKVLRSHHCALGIIAQQPIKELAVYYQHL